MDRIRGQTTQTSGEIALREEERLRLDTVLAHQLVEPLQDERLQHGIITMPQGLKPRRDRPEIMPEAPQE
jgi:hypothetical protein